MYNAQYILVRKDIIEKYGIGFACAQICHASMAPISNQLRKDFNKPIIEALDKDSKDWLENSFVKLVYEVENLEKMYMVIDRLDSDGIEYVKIVESKINELTCIGLRPYNKGKIAPYFKDLKKL